METKHNIYEEKKETKGVVGKTIKKIVHLTEVAGSKEFDLAAMTIFFTDGSFMEVNTQVDTDYSTHLECEATHVRLD